MNKCIKLMASSRFKHRTYVLWICFGFRISRFGFLQVALLLFLIATLAGCGDSGPKRYDVSGEVTWEGAPLGDGDILLKPTDGGVPDHGKIVAGKFNFRATAGAKEVSIMATKAAANIDPDMGVAPQVGYIPPCYNVDTTLNANVDPEGENHFTFTLTEQE